MTVEKFIRILGYIVYFMLWSPIIAVVLLIMPFVYLVAGLRIGASIGEIATIYFGTLKAAMRHDLEFIRTGVWY